MFVHWGCPLLLLKPRDCHIKKLGVGYWRMRYNMEGALSYSSCGPRDVSNATRGHLKRPYRGRPQLASYPWQLPDMWVRPSEVHQLSVGYQLHIETSKAGPDRRTNQLTHRVMKNNKWFLFLAIDFFGVVCYLAIDNQYLIRNELTQGYFVLMQCLLLHQTLIQYIHTYKT